MVTKQYSAPTVSLRGNLEALTHGQSVGSVVDAAFTVLPGQPVPNITFS